MAVSASVTIINKILQNSKYSDTREKLQKLLIDRQIPYLSSNDSLEVLKGLGIGTFGKVEIVCYQNRLYAYKHPIYNSFKQRNNILEEAIKLTDIVEYHPNIQRLYFINLNTFGFLMEYCGCGSLDAHVLNDSTTYTFMDVLHWSYQLADALSFLHSRNIMHRDVKMQNVLLKDDYHTLVLTDYGTATELGRSLLTNQVGTPIIMAPEVCSGTKYTEKCDIYSWAIVFHQLLSKQSNPYGDSKFTSFALLIKISMENYRPCKLEKCPKLLDALMYRSWHSDPKERPTLSFIKKVLRLIINTLPKDKAEYSQAMILVDKQQWVNNCSEPEKHLLTEPLSNNETSMNIYQDCLRTTKHVLDIKKDLSDINQQLNQCWKEKETKSDHYDQILTENERLQQEIERLRGKIHS
ncbi:hypothetical protein I4U23_018254 [Adineta vaga]|nr:hypothetical protein I4U23_018254 [Adineta vaga]